MIILVLKSILSKFSGISIPLWLVLVVVGLLSGIIYFDKNQINSLTSDNASLRTELTTVGIHLDSEKLLSHIKQQNQ